MIGSPDQIIEGLENLTEMLSSHISDLNVQVRERDGSITELLDEIARQEKHLTRLRSENTVLRNIGPSRRRV